MKGLSRHLSYANVVATMALVFAMGGSAIAARHYLITSTSQISPKVLSALRGEHGPEGKQGPAGKEGAAGREGAAGHEGAKGDAGPKGEPGPPGEPGPKGENGSGGTGLSESEQKTLKAILPFIKFVSTGVGGKPTIQFSGANVQIVDGAGSETAVNGTGNLIVGYDAEAGAQTGSHDLVMGTKAQAYTGYGEILGGSENTVSGPWSTVLGQHDLGSGEWSAVLGGNRNTASSPNSTVAGGQNNTAGAENASVTGGEKNVASGEASSVTGGKENTVSAAGKFGAILGGKAQTLAVEFGHTP